MPQNPESWLIDGPDNAPWTIILAHGAGAPMDSPFMTVIAQGLATAGLKVIRFEFAYMHRRRTEGIRPGPDRAPKLQACWQQTIAAAGNPGRTIIGGKSMGGRIASMVAQDSGVAGLICLGYPFHPPGRPEKQRTAHLAQIQTPTLILQGERDPFGPPDDVAAYDLSPAIAMTWLPDGDHSFKPRQRSGFTEQQNLDTAIEEITKFAAALC
ncbi:MAG: alpha/beta family hydrolase [Alphaproteobacteria bacterium]